MYLQRMNVLQDHVTGHVDHVTLQLHTLLNHKCKHMYLKLLVALI
jgi:hypothetical protein